jgi:hypothetical protein
MPVTRSSTPTSDRHPDGRNRDLGQALDVVAAWWGVQDLEQQFILGTFFPGRAFAADADSAFFGELIVSYQF